jgi:hypothetical protein
MVLMGYSGARGTLIYEKNLMSKISCQTPFKGLLTCFKSQKPVSAFKAKKGGICFEVAYATKMLGGLRRSIPLLLSCSGII